MKNTKVHDMASVILSYYHFTSFNMAVCRLKKEPIRVYPSLRSVILTDKLRVFTWYSSFCL